MENIKTLKIIAFVLLLNIFNIGCSQTNSNKMIESFYTKETNKLAPEVVANNSRILKLEEFKKTIEIIKYHRSTMYPIQYYIVWKNKSENSIKYAWFKFDLYNNVNDLVERNRTAKFIGPIKPNTVVGEDIIFSPSFGIDDLTINYMVITGVEIEYFNGTTLSTSDINIIRELGYFREPNKIN